jgi:tetratricopeptide (TPR) repeat protein
VIRPARAARAALLALAALAAAPVPEARAQAPNRANQAKAGVLFEKAQKHYQAGEYSAAIKLFTEAYELVRDPIYLFNLAQTYRKVLDCVKASEHYERYLADATDADAKQRERVQQWLREIAPCVEQRREEAERARRAEEEARARQAEALRREREEAARRPVEIDRGRNLRIAGIATASVGGVGLVLGTWFTVRGSQLKSELAEACANGCDWTELDGRDAAGRRANTIAAVGWIGGGLAVGGGAALYLLGRARIEHVQLAPVEGGATVSARLSF